MLMPMAVALNPGLLARPVLPDLLAKKVRLEKLERRALLDR